MTRGTTTPDCSQRISSVVTPNSRKVNVIPIKIAVAVHRTCIARTTSVRWTSFCMHVGLVPSRNKHAKMSPREIGGVD